MVEYDCNGFRIHPGHDGLHGPCMGETVWLIHRGDDKLWGVWPTRHAAVGWLATSHLRQINPEGDLKPVAIPAGSIRFNDVVMMDLEATS